MDKGNGDSWMLEEHAELRCTKNGQKRPSGGGLVVAMSNDDGDNGGSQP